MTWASIGVCRAHATADAAADDAEASAADAVVDDAADTAADATAATDVVDAADATVVEWCALFNVNKWNL